MSALLLAAAHRPTNGDGLAEVAGLLVLFVLSHALLSFHLRVYRERRDELERDRRAGF